MGMTRAALDLQIQQDTQRAIATLQKNMNHLGGMMHNIDSNMRQSHVALFNDITQLRFRVNFLMGELKKGMTAEDEKDLEERFKAFAKSEAEKMDKDIADAMTARERAIEVARAEAAAKQVGEPNKDLVQGPGSENTPNVV